MCVTTRNVCTQNLYKFSVKSLRNFEFKFGIQNLFRVIASKTSSFKWAITFRLE